MCPSIGGWINKPWGIQAVEYYAAVKKNTGCLHHRRISAFDDEWSGLMGFHAGAPGPAVLEDPLGCSPGRRHFVEGGFGGLIF